MKEGMMKMEKISFILEKELLTFEYVTNALVVLETALSPDNQAGILNSDIIHNQVWNLSEIMEDTLKSMKEKVGAYHA